MVRVKALDHVCLEVPRTQADEAIAFYVERWGLQLFEYSEQGTAFLRTAESGHHALQIRPGLALRLEHIAFEVPERDDLKRAVDDALRTGVAVEKEPGIAIEPGHQDSVRLRDPDGNLIELIWGLEHVPNEYEAPVVKPRKLGHVVLFTPKQPDMEVFYRQLGFLVIDRTARGMSFLHCYRDHHTLALVQSKRTGVQHIAYDVVTLDNVMKALGAFRRLGISCLWGPGRHGPGNNIFTYYMDPVGTIIEYYAEMEQIPDDAEPVKEHFWGPEWSGDRWGVAGPPPPVFHGED
jgi:catechol 2,3-dioxygenase-like lactoylglutathione lyase family enzyme